MSREILGTDMNGRVDYSLPTPIMCDAIPLTSGTINSVTTPPNFNRAYFSPGVGANVWVTFDGTDPVIPSENTRCAQELNPNGRKLNIDGGQTIKMICDISTVVGIRYDLGA